MCVCLGDFKATFSKLVYHLKTKKPGVFVFVWKMRCMGDGGGLQNVFVC